MNKIILATSGAGITIIGMLVGSLIKPETDGYDVNKVITTIQQSVKFDWKHYTIVQLPDGTFSVRLKP